MRLFLLFLLISATVHLLLIVFMPSLSIAKPYEKVIPVQVEVLDIQKKVIPEVVENKLSAMPSIVTANNNPKPTDNAPKTKNVETPEETKGKGEDKPLVLPSVNIPKSATESEASVRLPDVEDIATADNPKTFKGPNVDNELKSQDSARKSNQDGDKGRKSEDGNVSGNDIGQDVFDYDEKPTNNRHIVYVPSQPEFSLPNDTSIKVKFNIDRYGSTRDIQLVTRNQQIVEDIARDYVSKLKFNSVLYDKLDSSQITLHFKVRKK